MRKPNYRYWDKKTKEMKQVFRLCIPCEKVQYMGQTDGNLWTPFADIELMESTHYKDKSGTEIFEGDILWYPSDTRVPGDPTTETFRTIDEFYTDFMGLLNSAGLNTMDCEIVGNIYENPDILKGGEQ